MGKAGSVLKNLRMNLSLETVCSHDPANGLSTTLKAPSSTRYVLEITPHQTDKTMSEQGYHGQTN